MIAFALVLLWLAGAFAMLAGELLDQSWLAVAGGVALSAASIGLAGVIETII